MELRHLRYFVATVEWKSLREASRRIHVAQPAISQTISNLEAELGVKLLTRSGGRSIKLTSEGNSSIRNLSRPSSRPTIPLNLSNAPPAAKSVPCQSILNRLSLGRPAIG